MRVTDYSADAVCIFHNSEVHCSLHFSSYDLQRYASRVQLWLQLLARYITKIQPLYTELTPSIGSLILSLAEPKKLYRGPAKLDKRHFTLRIHFIIDFLLSLNSQIGA